MALMAYRHTDTGQAALLLFHNLEDKVLADKFLIFLGEITLELKKESGQGIGLTHILGVIILIQVNDAEEIGEQGLALKDVCVRTGLAIANGVIVKLIIYLTQYLLNDILKGYQARCAPKLIDHDGHMYAACLEVMQKVINLTGLGYEECRTDK